MIKYFGKKDIKEKINELIKEMYEDEELSYTIQIYENRENEKISKLMIEVADISNSMPDF